MEEQVSSANSKPSWAHRATEIVNVFANHNFYVNGFTPRELRTTLEDLGPTYVKVGQIMSSRTDLLPKAYCEELEKLRSSVAPLDAETARAVIEQEAGQRIEDLYLEFRDEPLGSASIAQAHYGVLLDGTPVVTKVQRPLIADMMRRDFVLLKKLASMVTVMGEENPQGAVDFRSVVGELEKVTEEELDFQEEAKDTKQFRELCIQDESVISCPRIIDELTTQRILTMTFVDGYSLSHADRIEKDGYDRAEIGRALIENYLHQVLDVGVFHGDPHQGNIMLAKGVPNWIDFGMMGRIDKNGIGVIQDVIFALVTKDVEALDAKRLAHQGLIMPVGRKAGTSRFLLAFPCVYPLRRRYIIKRNIQYTFGSRLQGILTGCSRKGLVDHEDRANTFGVGGCSLAVYQQGRGFAVHFATDCKLNA